MWFSRPCLATVVAAVAVAVCLARPSLGLPVPTMPHVDDDGFHANWMGALYPVIANRTLLDLSLPGTHDSMSWDLSTTVADGANDISPVLAWVLHEFAGFFPGDFARDQSRTQGLNMTQQLDNGVRFIDFRVVYSASPSGPSTGPYDWYCLHFVQTNNVAASYLQQLRGWLDAHPTEIVVLWLSKHGSNCGTEFDGVAPDALRQLWTDVEEIFEGVMVDTSRSPANATTVAQLLDRNHRLLMYVEDWHNVTNDSVYAYDDCLVDNWLGDDVQREPSTIDVLLDALLVADQTKAQDAAQNQFFLMSMAGGGPTAQIAYAAMLKFVPFLNVNNSIGSACAGLFHIPNMTQWCPMHLQTTCQLTNYYNQIVLELAIERGLDLPNAVYLDAFDVNGTIRTGTGDFGPDPSLPRPLSAVAADHNSTSYAYVDTFLLYNVLSTCRTLAPPAPPACASLTAYLQQRRALFPIQLWDDPEHGRLVGWPPVNITVPGLPPAATAAAAAGW